MGISSKIPGTTEKKMYEKRICTGIVIFKYEESCINKKVFLQISICSNILCVSILLHNHIYIYIYYDHTHIYKYKM